MYYKPQVDVATPRPKSMDEAIAQTEAWSDCNIDYVDQNSEDLRLGIHAGQLSIGHESEDSGFPITKQAMSILLKRMGLPLSISNIFDTQSKETYMAARESKIERGIDFLNGLFKDLKVNLTIRTRDDYIRSILGPSDALIHYDKVMKACAKAFEKLNWYPKPASFREFLPTDSCLSLAMTKGKADTDIDNLRIGVKLIISENGEVKNDIYTYVFRLICSNGLMGWGPAASRFIGLRELRNSPSRAIRHGVSSAYAYANKLADASVRLSEYRLPKAKGDERLAIIEKAMDKVSPVIAIPRHKRAEVQAVWSSSENPKMRRSLYGLQNAITTLARDLHGTNRMTLERVAGRLVHQNDSKLAAFVK